ncbi:MAG TPA: LD-carboxypeptidase [Blastocatellia bacterium]|nr:LD-carboxypeptidase [Blastocatellia bacterium]HMX29958.1 LD-carboxypeptidase [Blastocatellia bacterium]HMY70240.1 LD-carboxypeptidase [Blastocatellia bacterium]HNG34299.1 LD-carboxypeptidase [Blastocatellia bacterium]
MIQNEKKLITPAALRLDDTVAIVAPASNLKSDYLARGVAELERLGFRARHRADILDKARYTAGSDARRAEELMQAFADPEIKAVWAARGGYGVMRILPLLDEALLRANPKIFIGYSDMTALHLYLYRRFGWVTFHGPMAAKDLAGGAEHYDCDSLLAALTQTQPIGEIKASNTEMLHQASGQVVSGRLLGGCLSLIAAMMGTPDEPDTRGAILFLEDTGTRPYALDRMLQQLRLAGKFDDVRGIVFGEMTDCVQHAEQGYTLQEMLAECTADLGVPVMFGLRSGHSPRGNLTLPLGVQVTLDAARGVLRVDESAVS